MLYKIRNCNYLLDMNDYRKLQFAKEKSRPFIENKISGVDPEIINTNISFTEMR